MAATRPRLPIEGHAAAILQRVEQNRVTFIIGATGCGKSTQIPQMLHARMRGRVLCVQPRRVAVVAVATRVAEELDVQLGEGVVGYHIGAAKVAEIDKTRLMFVTAGIFLEMLKCQGAESIKNFGAVVIDEVHERSCENDLALASLIQLVLHTKELRSIKIVLMSATADIRRYEEFFKLLCDESGGRPATYAVSEGSKVYNTRVHYLRDALVTARYQNPDKELTKFEKHDRTTADHINYLISLLVPELIKSAIADYGPGCTVLIFLATYAMIEQAYSSLQKTLKPDIPIYVLHSSVDMEDCMAALIGEDGAAARVMIASSVAESSLTIKRVAHVVDSCRACEIHWSPANGESSPQIVWVSKAQAQQRAGRTGRTNDGTVWRLITASMFHQLPEFEMATLQLQLLRKELLLLTCSSSKHMSDAHKIFASCLDPPKSVVVARAEEWLLAEKMLEGPPLGNLKAQKHQRKSALPLHPTPLGELLDALPVEIELAKLVMLGALMGLLDEMVILVSLRSCQPMPIKREPNKQIEYEAMIKQYGPAHAEMDAFPEEELLANLGAYLSFQRWCQDPRRLHRLQHLKDSSYEYSELIGDLVQLGGLQNRPELNGERVIVQKYDSLRKRYVVALKSGERILVRHINLIEAEVEWCQERNLSRTALLAAERNVEHIMHALYRHFPPILHRNLVQRAAHPPPLRTGTGPEGPDTENPTPIFSQMVAKRAEQLLRKLLQLLRMPQNRHAVSGQPLSEEKRPCLFFVRGCCSVDKCQYSHEQWFDGRPVCKYALTGSCRFGARCRKRHPIVAAPPDAPHEVVALQGHAQKGLGSQMHLFARVQVVGSVTDGESANCSPTPDYTQYCSVLLLGEGDFSFAAWLASRAHRQGAQSKLTATAVSASTLQSRSEVIQSHPAVAQQCLAQLQAFGATVLFEVDARRLNEHPWLVTPVECIIWNNPFVADIEPGQSVKSEPNQALLYGFFASVIRCVQRWHSSVQAFALPMIYITVGVNQFVDWNVLAIANSCFLRIVSVHCFDISQHGQYVPCCNERDDTFDAGEQRTYAFAVDGARMMAATSASK